MLHQPKGRLLNRSPALAQRRATFATAPETKPSSIYDWTTSLTASDVQLAAFDREVGGLHDAVAVGNHDVWGDPLPERLSRENGGLPTALRFGVEALAGVSLGDVKVHYGSSKPAELDARAFAQGSDIYIGPGHEADLPHEAWHVAQQKQGRVAANHRANGVAINNDPGLEREADVMGARAASMGATRVGAGPGARAVASGASAPVQRRLGITLNDHVAVTEPGQPSWFGVVVWTSPDQTTYGVRIGGTDIVKEVPQAQVDYSDVTQKVKPGKVELQDWFAQLPSMSIGGHVAAFRGGGGVAERVADALDEVEKDEDIAALTVATFEYMAQRADVVGARITHDLDALGGTRLDEPGTRYMRQVDGALRNKIGKGVFGGLMDGFNDGQSIQSGDLDATEFLRDGKRQLIDKATQAIAQGRSVPALLQELARNMDSKSYGRRRDACEGLVVENLPFVEEGEGPIFDEEFEADELYEFFDRDNRYEKVAASDLVVSDTEIKIYDVRYNRQSPIPVVIGQKTGNKLIIIDWTEELQKAQEAEIKTNE